MGTCLSTETMGQPGHMATKSSLKSRSDSSHPRRLTIVIPGKSAAKANAAFVSSPSERTTATQPPTPSTPLSNGFASPLTAASSSSTPQLESLAEDEYEEDENKENVYQERQESHRFVDSSSLKFNRGNNVIDSIITEEESLGAPSDEEDMHDLHLKNRRDRDQGAFPTASITNGGDHPHAQPMRAAPLSTRSQSRIKILSKRVTNPASIIQRPPPLVAPPKGAVPGVVATAKTAVNPQTIADFNRLKIQVQLASRAEKHRLHKSKLEDRFEDIKGYRNLWSDYEEIQQQVHSDVDSRGGERARSRSDSLDLKQPKTWYFDFKALKGKIQCADDDDDNRSQVSRLSLHSEASMEVQRRLFLDKQRQRRRRHRNKGVVRDKRNLSDDRSITSINSSVSRASGVSFVRGQTDGSDYGPIKQIITSGASIISMDAVGSDDSTPRAKSRGGVEGDDYSRTGGYNDDFSIISDLDMDNDYNVPRRRRRKNHTDDSSLEDGRSLDGYGALTSLDFVTTDFQPRISDDAPPSIEFRKRVVPDYATRVAEYGFDPSAPLSSQLDIFSDPTVQIDDAETGVVRWRNFPDSTETGGKMSSARRLEDLYGADEEVDTAATVKEKASTTMVSREEPKDCEEKATDETKDEQQETLAQQSSKETTKTVEGRQTLEPEESKLRVKSRDRLKDCQKKVTHEIGEQQEFTVGEQQETLDERTSMGSSDIANDTETPQSKESELPGESVPGILGGIAAKKLIDVATPTKHISDTPTDEKDNLADKKSNDVVTDENPKSEAQESTDCQSPNNYFRHNPYEQMSSEQFMMMSTLATSSELNEDDNHTGALKEEEGQSEVSETYEIEKRSSPLKKFVEGMSTEAFLGLSAWHTGDYPSDLSTSLEVSYIDVAPKNLSFRAAADSSTLEVSQNIQNPSEVSTSTLGMASTDMTTLSESREDNAVDGSLCNVSSAQDRQVSIDRCDELAEKVTDQIGKLLCKFRVKQG